MASGVGGCRGGGGDCTEELAQRSAAPPQRRWRSAATHYQWEGGKRRGIAVIDAPGRKALAKQKRDSFIGEGGGRGLVKQLD